MIKKKKQKKYEAAGKTYFYANSVYITFDITFSI